MTAEVQTIITQMLANEFNITNNETLLNVGENDMAVMYENMKAIQEKFGLTEMQMAEICDKIFH